MMAVSLTQHAVLPEREARPLCPGNNVKLVARVLCKAGYEALV